jgi:hypothetical protein
MTSHCGSPAALDGDEHFQVQPGEPGGRMICETMCCSGYDIGQLRARPIHLLSVFSPERGEVERIERARSGFQLALRHVQVASGRSEIGVAQQQLNGI